MKQFIWRKEKEYESRKKIENLKKHCKVRAWGSHSKYTGKCPLLGNGLDCHFEDLSDTALDECLQKFEEYTEKFKLNEEGEIVNE